MSVSCHEKLGTEPPKRRNERIRDFLFCTPNAFEVRVWPVPRFISGAYSWCQTVGSDARRSDAHRVVKNCRRSGTALEARMSDGQQLSANGVLPRPLVWLVETGMLLLLEERGPHVADYFVCRATCGPCRPCNWKSFRLKQEKFRPGW